MSWRVRIAALLAMVLLLTLDAAAGHAAPPRAPTTHVVGPGWEAFFLEALGHAREPLPAGLKLERVSIERSAVEAVYTRPGAPPLRLVLVHPRAGTGALATTRQFALLPAPGQPGEQIPADLVKLLAGRLARSEAKFRWAEEGREPTLIPITDSRPPAHVLTPAETALYQKALAHAKAGRTRQAIADATALSPKTATPDAILAAASILRRVGEGRVAGLLVANAGRHTAPVLVELAASHLLAGQAGLAESNLAELAREHRSAYPTRVAALGAALAVLVHEGRVAEAKRLAPPLPPTATRQREVYYLRLRLAEAARDDAMLDETARAALAAVPDDQDVLYFWGAYYYGHGRMDRAIPPWDQLAKLNWRWPRFLGQYGTAYLVGERLDRLALEKLLARYEKNPKDIVAAFLAGHGLYYQKEYTNVIRLLTPVAKAIPEEPRARLYLAMSYFFTGKRDIAVKQLEDLEPYAVQDPDVFYCRSLVYRKRDLPRAIREMERFLEVFEGEKRPGFGQQKVDKARSDLKRMRQGEVPELNIPGQALVPAQ